MKHNQILETCIPVRDLANRLIGKIVQVGVDAENEELSFAVLKARSSGKDESLMILPKRLLRSLKVNKPDEFVVALTSDQLQTSPIKFGFGWPDIVCHDWARRLRSHLSGSENSGILQCTND